MFGLDAFMLARIQFAFTVSFHIIFPAITIGLATYLAVLEGLWLKTRNPNYQKLYHSGRKFLRLTLGWALYLALSWPINSAPTGVVSPTSLVLSRAHY